MMQHTSHRHPSHPPSLAPFDFQPRTRVVFGENTIERVGELAQEIGGKRALLVTDKGIAAAGHPARATGFLEAAGLAVTIFDEVRENPTTLDVERCVEVARAAGIDLIVGLGGGSSMDTAKGVNFILTNGGQMQDYWGVGKAKKPMLPMIAIPTTAGTGSECQSFALISNEETHLKMACGDPEGGGACGDPRSSAHDFTTFSRHRLHGHRRPGACARDFGDQAPDAALGALFPPVVPALH